MQLAWQAIDIWVGGHVQIVIIVNRFVINLLKYNLLFITSLVYLYLECCVRGDDLITISLNFFLFYVLIPAFSHVV